MRTPAFQIGEGPKMMQEAAIKVSQKSGIPVFHIGDFGSSVKYADFDLARLERRMSLLPYPHRHNFYHIVWVMNGTGTHIIDSVSYPVRNNSIFFMAPGQIHDFTLSEDTTGFTLNFSDEFVQYGGYFRNIISDSAFFRAESPVHALYLDQAQSEALSHVIHSLEEEYYNHLGLYRQEMIRSLLQIFMMKSGRFVEAVAVQKVIPRSILLTQKFKMLLDTEPLMICSVRRYAAKLHVTERYLSEATKAATGLSATALIHQRLVLEAKRLLAHSEHNIAMIAMRLGFDDPAYFSRFFKKHVGQTPLDFKKANGNVRCC